MNPLFFRLRFLFELLALPFFIFLVIHLAGHGSMLFFDAEHEHTHEHDHSVEAFFSEEILFGILFLIIFVGIWSLPALKKWVPCRHEHCHTESSSPTHYLAIIAFCLHFFPEAGVRHEIFSSFSLSDFLSLSAAIGFFSHFLVDIIVAVLLVSYFSSRKKAVLTFAGIVLVWILAFFVGSRFFDLLPHLAEGFIFLLSAFLLAMFVHFPHFPKSCGKCHDH